MADDDVFFDALQTHGLTLGVVEVCKLLRVKSRELAAIPYDVLPRIRVSRGSSRLIFLTLDVLSYRDTHLKMDVEELRMMCMCEALSLFPSEAMRREDVAELFYISPATVSRLSSLHPALRPTIEGKGRRPGEYDCQVIIDFLFENRKDWFDADK